MANLICNLKSGSDWTINDLTAYNITIVQQDAATFFGQAALPLPPHHPDLLNSLTADEMADEDRLSGTWISRWIQFQVKSLLLTILPCNFCA
jgi:hypothetical protein